MLTTDAIRQFVDTYPNANTRRTYRETLVAFVAFLSDHHQGRDQRLGQLSWQDIQAFQEWEEARLRHDGQGPLSPVTVQRRLKVIRVFTRWCVKGGLLEQNPAAALPLPDVRRLPASDKAIPLETLQRTISALRRQIAFDITDQRDAGYISRQPERDLWLLVAFATLGMRRGDVHRMRTRDTDTESRLIYLGHRKGGIMQYAPIGEPFIEALERWLSVRPRCAHDFVLCSMNSRSHQPLQEKSVSQAFRRSVRAATGESWGPHSVRHRWITEARRAGVDDAIIMAITGIRTRRILDDHYDAKELADQRRAVERGLLLQGRPSPQPEPVVVAQEQGVAENEEALYVTLDQGTWFASW